MGLDRPRVAVALSDDPPEAPWIVVRFGALPLWGLYRLVAAFVGDAYGARRRDAVPGPPVEVQPG